jgi:hypothetical protein
MPALLISAPRSCERSILPVNCEESHVLLCCHPSLRKFASPLRSCSLIISCCSPTSSAFGSRSAHMPRRYGRTLNSYCIPTSQVACHCIIRLSLRPISSRACQSQRHETEVRLVPGQAQKPSAQALTTSTRHPSPLLILPRPHSHPPIYPPIRL